MPCSSELRHLPSLPFIYIYMFFLSLFLFLSFTVCVHLLDNCIFYSSLPDTYQTPSVLVCCLQSGKRTNKSYERGKKKNPPDLIYFILILVFLCKYFCFRAVNFFFSLPKTMSSCLCVLSYLEYLNVNLAVSLCRPIPRLL